MVSRACCVTVWAIVGAIYAPMPYILWGQCPLKPAPGSAAYAHHWLLTEVLPPLALHEKKQMVGCSLDRNVVK